MTTNIFADGMKMPVSIKKASRVQAARSFEYVLTCPKSVGKRGKQTGRNPEAIRGTRRADCTQREK